MVRYLGIGAVPILIKLGIIVLVRISDSNKYYSYLLGVVGGDMGYFMKLDI